MFPVRFLHNDAPCKVCAPFLPEMGVNLFNMGFDVTLSDLKALTRNQVTLVGNLPPRDVLAKADPAGVAQATAAMLDAVRDPTRIVCSCGGGMPPGVSTANVEAFLAGCPQPTPPAGVEIDAGYADRGPV